MGMENKLRSMIMIFIFAVIVISLAASLIPELAIQGNVLLTNFTDSAIYGSTGAVVGTVTQNNLPILWVVAGVTLFLSIVGAFAGVAKFKSRNRRY